MNKYNIHNSHGTWLEIEKGMFFYINPVGLNCSKKYVRIVESDLGSKSPVMEMDGSYLKEIGLH
jgi:hypothetical protein